MAHAWGWTGTFGIIFGVHRCHRCGVYASEKTVQEVCR